MSETCDFFQSSDGSLSEVVQKWKEYQLQCQKYLYETPHIVAGKLIW